VIPINETISPVTVQMSCFEQNKAVRRCFTNTMQTKKYKTCVSFQKRCLQGHLPWLLHESIYHSRDLQTLATPTNHSASVLFMWQDVIKGRIAAYSTPVADRPVQTAASHPQ